MMHDKVREFGGPVYVWVALLGGILAESCGGTWWKFVAGLAFGSTAACIMSVTMRER